MFRFRLSSGEISARASKHLRLGRAVPGQEYQQAITALGAITPLEAEARLARVFDRLALTRFATLPSVEADFPKAVVLRLAFALAQASQPPWTNSLMLVLLGDERKESASAAGAACEEPEAVAEDHAPHARPLPRVVGGRGAAAPPPPTPPTEEGEDQPPPPSGWRERMAADARAAPPQSPRAIEEDEDERPAPRGGPGGPRGQFAAAPPRFLRNIGDDEDDRTEPRTRPERRGTLASAAPVRPPRSITSDEDGPRAVRGGGCGRRKRARSPSDSDAEPDSPAEDRGGDTDFYRKSPYRVTVSPAQRLRERLAEWRDRPVPGELSRLWLQAHRELELLLFHDAADVVRVHMRGRHKYLQRRYEWKEEAQRNLDLIIMALPTVRRLGETVIQIIELQRLAEFKSDGNTEGGVVDEDVLLPVRVATWRRFGGMVPREIPGQRTLPTASRCMPNGWLWWGIFVAEVDPEYLREAVEEAATAYEREYSRRLGRAVVPYSEWRRSRAASGAAQAPRTSFHGPPGSTAPQVHFGVGDAAPRWSRNQRRNAARKGQRPDWVRPASNPVGGPGGRAPPSATPYAGPATVGLARPAAR